MFWKIKNKSEKEGEVLLYGVISNESWYDDEVTPKQFKADLDALGDIGTLNIYINSDGGDVFAGQAIYSMLKRHKAQKNVYIDGLAASIASVVAMAGDTVYMPANAMMMIHNPWSIAAGNAEDFRKLAEALDKIRESIKAVYTEKTKLDDKKIIELMDAETWLTAGEAKELNFIDVVEEEKRIAASLNNGLLTVNGQAMDLRRYKNAPKLAEEKAEEVSEVKDTPEVKEEVIDNSWQAEVYKAKFDLLTKKRRKKE